MPVITGGGTVTYLTLLPAAPTTADSATTFPTIANNFFNAIWVMVENVNLTIRTLPATALTELPVPPQALDAAFATDADTFLASLPGMRTGVNAIITALSLPCSAVTALPTIPSRGGDPVNFASRAAALVAALTTLRTELNAFITALIAYVPGTGSWTSVHSMTPTSTSGGWNGYTARSTIPASALTDLSGTQMRITLQPRAVAGGSLAIAKMFVGPKGSGTWDMTSATQIFFGGSASGSATDPALLVSDAFSFSYDGTHDLVFMAYFNVSVSDVMTGPTGGTPTIGYTTGDDTANLTATGYTLATGVGNVDEFIKLIEVF